MISRKKSQTTERPPIGDPSNPDSLYHFMRRFLQWQLEHHYSKRTVENREQRLRHFIQWCDDRGLARPQDVTKPVIERYQRSLYLYRKKNGEPMSARTQHSHLTPIRAWFKWMTKQNYLLYNPAGEIELPKLPRQLPKHVLSLSEAEQVLNQPDVTSPSGIRDRAILETFYSTGIRRSELIHLKLYDVESSRGTLLIRQGKGNKDRVVPIGERALSWIHKYINEVRPSLSTPYDEGYLFLTRFGEYYDGGSMGQLVRGYVKRANIGKTGSCHLFRHTMATLMLENGADVRFIQALLGHSQLQTTEVYTRVSIQKLKAVHSATHPAKAYRTIVNELSEGHSEPLLDDLAAEAELED